MARQITFTCDQCSKEVDAPLLVTVNGTAIDNALYHDLEFCSRDCFTKWVKQFSIGKRGS